MKIKKALVASLLWVSVLILVYLVHITYFRVNVLFYSAILDAIIAASITGAILFLIQYFNDFNGFEKIQLITIWLLMGYAVAISLPTVLDRSLSFYILEKLDQRGGGIKLSQFNYVFTHEYIKEHRLIDVRLTEQQQSGTIVIKNDCVLLTDDGAELVRFSRYFRQNLLPKKRLLMGEYTDVLTDPFRDSEVSPGYECNE